MKYTVVWKTAAEYELADAWLAAVERNAVTQAANEIDLLLRNDPDSQGTINFDTVRTLAVLPIAVDFEVVPDDCMVWILSVWLLASEQPVPQEQLEL